MRRWGGVGELGDGGGGGTGGRRGEQRCVYVGVNFLLSRVVRLCVCLSVLVEGFFFFFLLFCCCCFWGSVVVVVVVFWGGQFLFCFLHFCIILFVCFCEVTVSFVFLWFLLICLFVFVCLLMLLLLLFVLFWHFCLFAGVFFFVVVVVVVVREGAEGGGCCCCLCFCCCLLYPQTSYPLHPELIPTTSIIHTCVRILRPALLTVDNPLSMIDFPVVFPKAHVLWGLVTRWTDPVAAGFSSPGESDTSNYISRANISSGQGSTGCRFQTVTGGGSERERQRQTHRETDRQREGGREGWREREREQKRKNTLLHKDKDLSTSRLFYKSVPGDKHGNTQYVKQEYK